MRVSGRPVPTFVINGKMRVGFHDAERTGPALFASNRSDLNDRDQLAA
ncbi:MAG: hypothetical protein ACREYE_13715 [Gammaproteobacteria bacterium]